MMYKILAHMALLVTLTQAPVSVKLISLDASEIRTIELDEATLKFIGTGTKYNSNRLEFIITNYLQNMRDKKYENVRLLRIPEELRDGDLITVQCVIDA